MPSSPTANPLVAIRSIKNELDHWHMTHQNQLVELHASLNKSIEQMRQKLFLLLDQPLRDEHGDIPNNSLSADDVNGITDKKHYISNPKHAQLVSMDTATPPRAPRSTAAKPSADDLLEHGTPMRNIDSRATPIGSPSSNERIPMDTLLARIAETANSPPINFDNLYEQLAGGRDGSDPNSPLQQPFGDPARPPAIPIDSIMQLKGQRQTKSYAVKGVENGRPVVQREGDEMEDSPAAIGIEPAAACQVLVEFKRKRVLQVESDTYVGPGQYVVVGGDRGEDVGLVIYTWGETLNKGVQGVGLAGASFTKNIGVGSGKVLRQATAFDVVQLHGMQSELERRAVEVCTARVLEHGLPMVIIDAEYQFDKKKLTFFYEAQQRLDFRELVRDLFKTFRARIWMETIELA